MITYTYPPLCAGEGKYFSLSKSHSYPEMDSYHSLDWRQLCWFAENPQCVPKEDAWWVIPSTLRGRMARTKLAQLAEGEFWMLCADIDQGNLSLSEVLSGLSQVLDPGTEFLIYASRSSKPDDRKWRVLMPTAGAVPAGAYHHLAALFNEALGIALGVEVDIVTERVQQYFYAPNKGDHYEQFLASGVPWGAAQDPQRALALANIARERLAADPERRQSTERAKERGRALSLFCERYPVETLMERYGFITRNGINWHHPDQTSKSYGTEVRPDGRWITASDTVEAMLGSKRGDAFDLFVAMEGGGDWKACYRAWEAQLLAEARALAEQYPFLLGFTCNGLSVEWGQ